MVVEPTQGGAECDPDDFGPFGALLGVPKAFDGVSERSLARGMLVLPSDASGSWDP